MRRVSLSLASLAFLLSSVPAPANATITEIIGGPGGKPFELRCPTGSEVVGVNANAGAWIDGLALLCSTDNHNVRQPTGYAGSSGGPIQQQYCPPGEGIKMITMTFTRGNGLKREYLNALGLECSSSGLICINTGEGCYHRYYHADTDSDAPEGDRMISADAIGCPRTETLIGVVGRAGKYVDAIGAICGLRAGTIEATTSSLRSSRPTPQWREPGGTQVQHEEGARPASSALPMSQQIHTSKGLRVPH